MLGKAVQGRASLTAVGSATIFSLVSSGRLHLTKGFVSVGVGAGTALFSIQETSAGGTTATVLVGKISASDTGVFSFDFGDHGIMASTTGSRIVAVLESSNSSVYCHAVGYVR